VGFFAIPPFLLPPLFKPPVLAITPFPPFPSSPGWREGVFFRHFFGPAFPVVGPPRPGVTPGPVFFWRQAFLPPTENPGLVHPDFAGARRGASYPLCSFCVKARYFSNSKPLNSPQTCVVNLLLQILHYAARDFRFPLFPVPDPSPPLPLMRLPSRSLRRLLVFLRCHAIGAPPSQDRFLPFRFSGFLDCSQFGIVISNHVWAASRLCSTFGSILPGRTLFRSGGAPQNHSLAGHGPKVGPLVPSLCPLSCRTVTFPAIPGASSVSLLFFHSSPTSFVKGAFK